MNIEKIVIISISQMIKKRRKKIRMIVVMKNQTKKKNRKIPKLKKIVIMKIVEMMIMIYPKKSQKIQIQTKSQEIVKASRKKQKNYQRQMPLLKQI